MSKVLIYSQEDLDLILEHEKTKNNIGLFIMNNGQWQPLEILEESNIDFYINVDNVKEEIIKQLKPVKQECNFMTDDGHKFKGTIKQKYLWTKYYWKKKGKRYKRFIKHSKQIVIEFEGKVVD